MAREATARLYDVDEDSVVFKKLQQTEKYDQGTVAFHARQGALINLDKLHESIWATRLSGSTRSGLVSLEVTAIGRVAGSSDRIVLRVAGSEAVFTLGRHPEAKYFVAFDELLGVAGEAVTLTGVVDNYMGRWPNVLRTKPTKPRRILVTSFEVLDESEEHAQ